MLQTKKSKLRLSVEATPLAQKAHRQLHEDPRTRTVHYSEQVGGAECQKRVLAGEKKVDDLIAAGYGQTSASDRSAGTVLRMVLMRVSQATRNWVMLVRAGEDDARGGHGDSGGPVFAYRGMHSLVAVIVGGTDNKTMAVALSAHYGEAQILEIMLLCGFYRTVSYLANGLRLPLEEKAARFPQ